MIRTLRQFDDAILKAVCEPIVAGEDLSWLRDLADTCHAHHGAGIAAPQIGIPKRAIYIAFGRSHGLTLVNPEISDPSEEMVADSEGCLSYPGTYALVERHASVWCAWWALDLGGRIGGIGGRRFNGFEARVLQHELDHLNGICRVGDVWRRERAGGGQPC